MQILMVILSILALLAVGLALNYAITHDERGKDEDDKDDV